MGDHEGVVDAARWLVLALLALAGCASSQVAHLRHFSAADPQVHGLDLSGNGRIDAQDVQFLGRLLDCTQSAVNRFHLSVPSAAKA